MGKSDEITEFIESGGGVASAAQLSKAGLLPGSVSYALKSGAIDKLTRGVYCTPRRVRRRVRRDIIQMEQVRPLARERTVPGGPLRP